MASPQYPVWTPVFFKWRNIEYSLESLVLSVYFPGSVEKSALETLHARSLFHPPPPLSLFSIFPSSFQRIVRAREYFTAGINQRNSGKQLIILLLTISRSLLRLPCAPPLLFSFNRKIGRGPPTIFFDFVCYFWFHWHCLRFCLLECSFTWSARLRLCLSAAMFLHATPAL